MWSSKLHEATRWCSKSIPCIPTYRRRFSNFKIQKTDLGNLLKIQTYYPPPPAVHLARNLEICIFKNTSRCFFCRWLFDHIMTVFSGVIVMPSQYFLWKAKWLSGKSENALWPGTEVCRAGQWEGRFLTEAWEWEGRDALGNTVSLCRRQGWKSRWRPDFPWIWMLCQGGCTISVGNGSHWRF